jgi:hypothetical protein
MACLEADLVLARDPGLLRDADPAPFRDPDLRLHDVEPGHLLGYRVLHWMRVHLDEVEGVRVRVEEELHGAGAT